MTTQEEKENEVAHNMRAGLLTMEEAIRKNQKIDVTTPTGIYNFIFWDHVPKGYFNMIFNSGFFYIVSSVDALNFVKRNIQEGKALEGSEVIEAEPLKTETLKRLGLILYARP